MWGLLRGYLLLFQIKVYHLPQSPHVVRVYPGSADEKFEITTGTPSALFIEDMRGCLSEFQISRLLHRKKIRTPCGGKEGRHTLI
jgi:hypothetical protein